MIRLPAKSTAKGLSAQVLGLTSQFTRLILLAFIAVTALVAGFSLPADADAWPVVVALLLLCAGAVAVTIGQGDPLGLEAAVTAGLMPPTSVLVVLVTEPQITETSRPAWLLGAVVILGIVLCLRGRIVIAWISFGSTYSVLIAFSTFAHEGMPPVSLMLILPCRLLIGTAFALVLRRSMHAVEVLNEDEVLEVVRNAVTRAAREERAVRLADLDSTVRPMLVRIASGENLSAEDMSTCALLEGQLRDQIQAAGLANPAVAGAARVARRRGVDVVMIDDGGLAEASNEVRRQVTDHVIEALRTTADGHLRIRILPPGRNILISIYRSGKNSGSMRIDLDVHGDPAADLAS